MINCLLYFYLIFTINAYKRDSVNLPENLPHRNHEVVREDPNVNNSSDLIEFSHNFFVNFEHFSADSVTLRDSNNETPMSTFDEVRDVKSVVKMRNKTGSGKTNSLNVTTAYPLLVTLSKPPAQMSVGRGNLIAECEELFWLLRRVWQGLSENESADAGHVTARHKNAYQKSFPIIIIAFMMMLAFVIPMGFQFMVMVGGKALLLSQMALIFGLSGAFKKWNMPDFTTYELPWNRANEPSANKFDADLALRKTTNKFVDKPYPHHNLYKLPYM